MKNLLLLSLCLILVNCQQSKDGVTEKDDHFIVELDNRPLSLIVAHNVNGETHPCGCREHPLGGLPEVAGFLGNLKKTNNVIHIDTGDLFFTSTNLPHTVHKSLTFNAKNLKGALERLGLNYFVPGDQDFALGRKFLKELLTDSPINMIVANLKNEKDFKHKKWVEIRQGKNRLYLIGIVSPAAMPAKTSGYFSSALPALKETVKKVKASGFDSENKNHRLIVLSHSGMPEDFNYAKAIPEINWIVGAHTQSFTNEPYPEGSTQLVQVLSRNHYLGEISIAGAEGREKDTWKIHQMRDGLENKINPNPYIKFIVDHKEQIGKIQQIEQEAMAKKFNKGEKIQTAASCLECHEDQYNFWQGTAHSIAYLTLVKAKEENNLTCLKCHTVGQGKESGYITAKGLVHFEKGSKQTIEDYWKNVLSQIKPPESVRDLSYKKRKVIAKNWQKIDEKMKVAHNFTNVQCLNCHGLHSDHPFHISDKTLTAKQKSKELKGKCLTCHNPDQAPDWYQKNAKGLPGELNEKAYLKALKQVSCPRS